MMKILAGVEQVSDDAILEKHNGHHALNNNSHEKPKTPDEKETEKPHEGHVSNCKAQAKTYK